MKSLSNKTISWIDFCFGYLQRRYNLENYSQRVEFAKEMKVEIDRLKEDFLNRKLSTLSNGEKFLVSLAATLAHNPKILILDDPTCFLDFKLQEKLVHLLKRMKNKLHKTIIILSNDVDFIHSISDYVYVLDEGKIIQKGSHEELVNINGYYKELYSKQLLEKEM